MSQFTSFRYTASTTEEYRNLAAFAATLQVNVVLNPATRVVIVYVPADDQNDTIAALGEYHGANKSLEAVKTENTIDAAANIEGHEEEIATIKSIADKANEETEKYRNYFYDEINKANRIKSQVDAISVLIGNIFPK